MDTPKNMFPPILVSIYYLHDKRLYILPCIF